ncbi:DUF5665 domain-containing protein [Patescibacteria group bacterium]|nr:DUF5665 domain-containing protein [Patescibacteria group bacterium]
MEKYENVHREIKTMIFNNLLGGIAWGFGATIGLSLVLVMLGFVARGINFVPVVGNFVSNVIIFILQKNPHLIK